MAEHLLREGADLNWVGPSDELTPLNAARRSDAHRLAGWLVTQGRRHRRRNAGRRPSDRRQTDQVVIDVQITVHKHRCWRS
jgi:hypothetical protein